MLETIKEFFLNLFEPIISLFDMIISFISDIVYIISLLGAFVVNLPNYLDWLPSACVTLLITVFSIVVIYKVLGREG